MNDEEIMQILQMQTPEQKIYESYNPAMQLKQGLLTPQEQMQTQNNQSMQEVRANADEKNKQMIENVNAGQQAAMMSNNNGQMQAQAAQSQQMLQQQEQADEQRRQQMIRLAMMMYGGG